MSVGVGSIQRSRIKWQPLPRSEPRTPAALRSSRAVEEHAVEDVPDLLHPEPRYMIDRETLSSQLAFAFAGGDAADNIRRVLSDVETLPSDWKAESFERHLFVSDFISTCCKLKLDGHTI